MRDARLIEIILLLPCCCCAFKGQSEIYLSNFKRLRCLKTCKCTLHWACSADEIFFKCTLQQHRMCFSNVHLSYLLQEDKSLTRGFFVPCFDVMNSDSTSSSPSFFLIPQQWTTHLTHTNHNLRNCVFVAGENGCQKPSPLLPSSASWPFAIFYWASSSCVDLVNMRHTLYRQTTAR